MCNHVILSHHLLITRHEIKSYNSSKGLEIIILHPTSFHGENGFASTFLYYLDWLSLSSYYHTHDSVTWVSHCTWLLTGHHSPSILTVTTQRDAPALLSWNVLAELLPLLSSSDLLPPDLSSCTALAYPLPWRPFLQSSVYPGNTPSEHFGLRRSMFVYLFRCGSVF